MKSIMNQVSSKLSKSDWKYYLVIGIVIIAFSMIIFLGELTTDRNKPTLDKPIEEMHVEIERDGRQADCSDLIGKWFVIENSASYEFKHSGRLSIRVFGQFESTHYRCNSAINLVSYTRGLLIGTERFECTDIMYLGKISDDNMVASWDYCSEGEEMVTRTMVREPE